MYPHMLSQHTRHLFGIACGLFKYRRTFLETVADTLSTALVGCGQYDTCFALLDSSHLSLVL